MKIDFGRFPMWTGIKREKTVALDVREVLADVVYKNLPGVAASSLAHRIYESKGEVELSGKDADLLRSIGHLMTGVFCDSLESALKCAASGGASASGDGADKAPAEGASSDVAAEGDSSAEG